MVARKGSWVRFPPASRKRRRGGCWQAAPGLGNTGPDLTSPSSGVLLPATSDYQRETTTTPPMVGALEYPIESNETKPDCPDRITSLL